MEVFWIIAGVLLVLAGLYLFLIAPSLKKNLQVRELGVCSFAHRGLHDRDQKIPENSLAAYRRAIVHGFGIEFDVHLTADGGLAVIHDDTVNRMTGAEGRVSQMTWEELAPLRLEGTEEKIPSLQEVLELVRGRVPLLVELKADGNNAAQLCPAAFRLLDAYQGPYVVESFDPRVLIWMRKNRPAVGRGQLATHEGPTPLLKWILQNLLCNVAARPHFIAYDSVYSGKTLSLILCRKLFGCPVYEWTIRDPKRYESNLRRGISNIFERFIP